MLKCGLKKEGVLRDALKDNSGITDCLIYSILRREYFESDN
ncbi:GNAT family N-acetyltransferase [Brachyspira catarrhinii]|nr:GNAT family protein [Brachyspira catarrhinii]